MGMKRWTKGTGIAITTLMLVAMQATMVLARSGGGRGGSLGGSAARSYGGSAAGGLSSGGLSSGIGFNSLAPFFLIGGSSTGGGSGSSGLFSLLFMLLVFYLIYKALRSSRLWAHGSSKYQGASKKKGSANKQGSGWFGQSTRPSRNEAKYEDNSVVDLSGRPINNSANQSRFASAIAFTRENMHHYNETFPRWDRDFLIGRTKQVFYWFQDGWSRQDLSQASEYLAPGLISKYSGDLNNMKLRGERNLIKEPTLNTDDIEFIHSDLGADGEHFTVMIYASLVDYTVDATGRLISGDDKHRLYFTEFWEFSWLDNKWVLSNIYQEDSLEVAQIARGEHS